MVMNVLILNAMTNKCTYIILLYTAGIKYPLKLLKPWIIKTLFLEYSYPIITSIY